MKIIKMENKINIWHSMISGKFDDTDKTWFSFLSILNHIPYITILNSIKYNFPLGGLSGIVIIAESHAAIHTWPEDKCCWVELATCGNPKALSIFEHAMKNIFPLSARDPSVLKEFFENDTKK